MDADGFVFHKGRADGAIVRGGFKVLPEKVCEMLRLHPAIAEAAVIGVADARLGQAPVAVIEPRPGQNIDAEEAERHLRSLLPSPHIPARFLFVDKLPYTDSLKVHLAEVRKLVAAATHG
jgi:acyl-CoA synthetase (AMP-forming)/AMP-acid ligase II